MYYNESEAESTTTNNTFQDKVVLTFTPSTIKNYLIIASGLVAHASTSYVTEVQLTIDGSVYAIKASENEPKMILSKLTRGGSILQPVDLERARVVN